MLGLQRINEDKIVISLFQLLALERVSWYISFFFFLITAKWLMWYLWVYLYTYLYKITLFECHLCHTTEITSFHNHFTAIKRKSYFPVKQIGYFEEDNRIHPFPAKLKHPTETGEHGIENGRQTEHPQGPTNHWYQPKIQPRRYASALGSFSFSRTLSAS